VYVDTIIMPSIKALYLEVTELVKKFPVLLNLNAQYHIHKHQLLVLILRQLNPINTFFL